MRQALVDAGEEPAAAAEDAAAVAVIDDAVAFAEASEPASGVIA
jgi:hypothetical protein